MPPKKSKKGPPPCSNTSEEPYKSYLHELSHGYLDDLRVKCSKEDLNKFSHLHTAFINQIFGDITVREIIKECFPKKGFFTVEKGEGAFLHSSHHVFSPSKYAKKICSADNRYQNTDTDTNDTLCQSYSLMSYFEMNFDKTPSDVASILVKYRRQIFMCHMYRFILASPEFLKKFKEVLHEENNALWKYPVREDEDDPDCICIIKELKTSEKIVSIIHKVLSIWEHYGWKHYVLKGTCSTPDISPKDIEDAHKDAAHAISTITYTGANSASKRLFHTPVSKRGRPPSSAVKAANSRPATRSAPRPSGSSGSRTRKRPRVGNSSSPSS